MSKKSKFNKIIGEMVKYISFEDILNKRYPKYKPFLEKEINRLIKENNDDCEDNYRVTMVDDVVYEEIYSLMKKRGCCGACDDIVEAKDGTKFKIGFNYGH